LRQLNLARAALLRAAPTTSTVKETFSRYGFQEPGRSAVVYRELFGESPSVTLQRARDDDLRAPRDPSLPTRSQSANPPGSGNLISLYGRPPNRP
jgi:hypothetical protein